MRGKRSEESIAKFKETMVRKREEREAAERKKANRAKTAKARKVMLANRAKRKKVKITLNGIEPSSHMNAETILYNGTKVQEELNRAFQALTLVDMIGWDIVKGIAVRIKTSES